MKEAKEGGKPTSLAFFVLDNLEVAWEVGGKGEVATRSVVST